VLIGDVSADTPGSRAGMKRGDVVLQLNGQPISSANDLRLRISQTAPGTAVKLQIWREGKTQDINVTLGELPEESAKAAPGENNSGALQGVEVQELTPEAAAAGLERGDIIQEVNHKPVPSIEQYRRAVATAGDQSVLLLVNQHGITRYVVVESH
jgi:serine protease Do